MLEGVAENRRRKRLVTGALLAAGVSLLIAAASGVSPPEATAAQWRNCGNHDAFTGERWA